MFWTYYLDFQQSIYTKDPFQKFVKKFFFALSAIIMWQIGGFELYNFFSNGQLEGFALCIQGNNDLHLK